MNKKWFQLILCLVLAVSVLTCTALALTPADVVAGDGVTCTVEGDKVTGVSVTCNTDLVAGKEYVLMIVKTAQKADTPAALLEKVKTTSDWTVGTDTILYIDQVANASGVSYQNFLPKSVTNSVILLGGEFANGVQSPKVLGVIMGSGADVTGKVTSYKPTVDATVDLYASTDTAHATSLYSTHIHAETGSGKTTQDFTIHGVADGTYDLVVTKAGHLSYVVKGVVVKGANVDLTAATGKDYANITLLAGNMNTDNAVNNTDLGVFRGMFNKRGAAITNANADINGDGSVNNTDLGAFRTAFNKRVDTHCTVAFGA